MFYFAKQLAQLNQPQGENEKIYLISKHPAAQTVKYK